MISKDQADTIADQLLLQQRERNLEDRHFPSRERATKWRIAPADRMALALAAIFSVGLAQLTMWWYDIQWREIYRGGFFSIPVFYGMFALVGGVPLYMAMRFVRRHRDLKKTLNRGDDHRTSSPPPPAHS